MATSFELDGRVVIVTGGLGQLGASFANALLDAGARVAILDMSDDPSRAKIPLQAVGEDRLRLFAGDVTSKASAERRAGKDRGGLGRALRPDQQCRHRFPARRAGQRERPFRGLSGRLASTGCSM